MLSSTGSVVTARRTHEPLRLEPLKLLRMSVERVALIPRCAECEAAWLPADEERWRAYLGCDDLDEPAEFVFYCPACAERELGPH
jgi:hypothetical protein